MSRDLGVVWPAKISEGCHSILLADFKSDDGTTGEIFNNGQVLGQNALIDIIKLLDDWARQVEQFHGGDFKARLQDHLENFASVTFPLNVRLDQTESTIVQNSRRLHRPLRWLLTREPIVMLPLIGAKRVGTMHTILGAISAEARSKRIWGLFSGRLRVGWTDGLPPSLHGVLTDKFHSDDDIARDEINEVWEEFLLFVLRVKSLS